MTIKGWLVNDTLSCIHGVRTLWHNLLEWFPNLEDKTNGYTDYSILAEVIENDIGNTDKKPDYIIRNGTYFRKLNTHIKSIILIQDNVINNSYLFNQQIKRHARGGSIPIISIQDLTNIQIPILPIADLEYAT